MQAPLQGASGSYLESVILSLNHAMMDCSMYSLLQVGYKVIQSLLRGGRLKESLSALSTVSVYCQFI